MTIHSAPNQDEIDKIIRDIQQSREIYYHSKDKAEELREQVNLKFAPLISIDIFHDYALLWKAVVTHDLDAVNKLISKNCALVNPISSNSFEDYILLQAIDESEFSSNNDDIFDYILHKSDFLIGANVQFNFIIHYKSSALDFIINNKIDNSDKALILLRCLLNSEKYDEAQKLCNQHKDFLSTFMLQCEDILFNAIKNQLRWKNGDSLTKLQNIIQIQRTLNIELDKCDYDICSELIKHQIKNNTDTTIKVLECLDFLTANGIHFSQEKLSSLDLFLLVNIAIQYKSATLVELLLKNDLELPFVIDHRQSITAQYRNNPNKIHRLARDVVNRKFTINPPLQIEDLGLNILKTSIFNSNEISLQMSDLLATGEGKIFWRLPYEQESEIRNILRSFLLDQENIFFSNIEKAEVVNQIIQYLQKPNLYDQGNYNTCGPTAALIGLMEYSPIYFAKKMVEFAKTGQYYSGSLDKTISCPDAYKHFRDLPRALMFCMKNQMNLLPYNPIATDKYADFKEALGNLTRPKTLCQYLNFLGYQDITEATLFLNSQGKEISRYKRGLIGGLYANNHQSEKSRDILLEKMIKDWKQGKVVIFFGSKLILNSINNTFDFSDLDQKSVDTFLSIETPHYMILDSIKLDQQTGKVSYSLFTWGKRVSGIAEKDDFLKIFNGYLSAKAPELKVDKRSNLKTDTVILKNDAQRLR